MYREQSKDWCDTEPCHTRPYFCMSWGVTISINDYKQITVKDLSHEKAIPLNPKLCSPLLWLWSLVSKAALRSGNTNKELQDPLEASGRQFTTLTSFCLFVSKHKKYTRNCTFKYQFMCVDTVLEQWFRCVCYLIGNPYNLNTGFG